MIHDWRSGLWMRLWRLLRPLRARWHKGLEVGSDFPDFTLKDNEGRAHRLSEDPSGRMTVLWFTNLCEDCRSRIPLLDELRQKAGDRYRVLAVSILGKDESLPRQAVPACGFPLLLDPEDVVGRKLGLPHPPDTCPIHNLFIVGPSRRILYRRHLSAFEPEEFRSLWERLLREESAGKMSALSSCGRSEP